MVMTHGLALLGLVAVILAGGTPAPGNATAAANEGIQLSHDGESWGTSLPLDWHPRNLAPGDSLTHSFWIFADGEEATIELKTLLRGDASLALHIELSLSIDGPPPSVRSGSGCALDHVPTLASLQDCGLLFVVPGGEPRSLTLSLEVSNEATNLLQGSFTGEVQFLLAVAKLPRTPAASATPSPISTAPSTPTSAPGRTTPRNTSTPSPKESPTTTPPPSTPGGALATPRPPTPPSRGFASLRAAIAAPAGIPVENFAMGIGGPGGFELPGTSISLNEAESGQPYAVWASHTGPEALQLASAECNVPLEPQLKSESSFVVVSPLEPGMAAHCEFHYVALERRAIPTPPGVGSGRRPPHGRDAWGLTTAIAAVAATTLFLAAARRIRWGCPPRGGSD